MATFIQLHGAVLSVARTSTRMRVAVSSMRARTAHHRTRTRIAALGSPSGEKYQFNKDNEMNEKSIKRKRGGRLRRLQAKKDNRKGRGFLRAVLSVARTTTRMRMAVSSMRMRTTHHRTRTRITALGSQTIMLRNSIKSFLRHTITRWWIAADEKPEPQ